MLTAIPSYKVLKDWKYFSNTMVLFKRSEQKAQDHLKKKKSQCISWRHRQFQKFTYFLLIFPSKPSGIQNSRN